MKFAEEVPNHFATSFVAKPASSPKWRETPTRPPLALARRFKLAKSRLPSDEKVSRQLPAGQNRPAPAPLLVGG